MKIKGKSYFKNPLEAEGFLEKWSAKMQSANGFYYSSVVIETVLGKTHIWTHNAEKQHCEAIVFFPGARTCSLFWDVDNQLAPLRKSYQLFLVDVNGQPSLSDGYSPAIDTEAYGQWASEVLTKLGLKNATVVGASLGGLICMKLCLVAPQKVNKAVLFNPAGIQPFSFSLKNLYYNFLPILKKDRPSIMRFFDHAIFHAPVHAISENFKDLLIEYMHYVLNQFQFRGDYPAKMRNEELRRLNREIYLVVGDKDILFPYKKTIMRAKEKISSLKAVNVIGQTAHGIETSKAAMKVLCDILDMSTEKKQDATTIRSSRTEK